MSWCCGTMKCPMLTSSFRCVALNTSHLIENYEYVTPFSQMAVLYY